ncbi:MAG: class I SAM-dependent methyltransferase [Phycisphaerae bacterium]
MERPGIEDEKGPIDVLPTREGYDQWSAVYDDEDNPLVALEEPHVERLLGNVHGLQIVDIGCGTGRHAAKLVHFGAQVTALDFSDGMMSKARCKPGAERIRFVVQNLERPLPLRTGAFDRVLCCLVLDHIADLRGLFGEFERICRVDGFIVISVMHPALMLRGIQARFINPATGREVRPQSCPNQIADYVTAAVQSGLSIDHISEHAVDENLVARSARAGKYLGWPMLLMMKCSPA